MGSVREEYSSNGSEGQEGKSNPDAGLPAIAAERGKPGVSKAHFLADPGWLAHRFDGGGSRIRFLHVDRATRARVPFLTDEHLPNGEARWLGSAEAVAGTSAPAPLGFVLHSAFCCSTLVANALEIEGLATALKEPVILNDIVGWRARGADARRVGAALDDVLKLLGRPFMAGEAVVIKPSNVTAPLWRTMLAQRQKAGALLLHAQLRTYLASVASKGMWGRLWVRELQWKLMRDGLADFGYSPEEVFRQSDLQVAALGWLAQHRLFAELIAQFGPARVRALDSETLLARPADALQALGQLFGVAMDEALARSIAAGPVFGRHAKTGEAFGAAERRAVHAGPAEANADEIDKVALWAEAVAAHAGIALTLSAPLLDQRPR